MSQLYRVTLKSSVSRVVKSCDSVTYPIELTELLPSDEMKEILVDVLKSDGFEALEGEETKLSKEGEAGEVIIWDLDEMTVVASLEEEKEIHKEVTGTGTGMDRRSAAEEQAKRDLKEQERIAENSLANQEGFIQNNLTKRLEKSNESRQRDLNKTLQRVYAEALKRKAGQLGQIMEIQEGVGEDGNYELTIKLEQ